MILKIIAEHGTHYRDGVEGLAVWAQQVGAHYVGKAPDGSYVPADIYNAMTDGAKAEGPAAAPNNVLANCWPCDGEDLEVLAISEINCIHVSYHNSKGAKAEQEELYIDEECKVYLMSDEGKTVERLI